MRKFYKPLSVLLAITMCVSLVVPAFADEEPAPTNLPTNEVVTDGNTTAELSGDVTPDLTPEPPAEPSEVITSDPTPETTLSDGAINNEGSGPDDDQETTGQQPPVQGSTIQQPQNTLSSNTLAEDCGIGKHDYQYVTTQEATCDGWGEKVSRCTKCGKDQPLVIPMPVPPLEHKWEFVSCAKKLDGALCIAGHNDLMKCSRCQKTEERVNAAGHDHDLVILRDAVDIGAIGEYDTDLLHTVKCQNCTYIETQEHDFAPATCTKPETCACGKEKLNSEPLDHDWSAEWSKDETNHWHVCSHSGCSEIELGSTAAHTWNDGVITKEATATAKGEKTFTCTVCGKTKTEEIPMLAIAVTLTSAVTVQVGQSTTLTATVSNAPEDAIQTLTWTSSDTTKATVADGTVTGVAATSEEAPVTITVTASVGENGRERTATATCAVTVTAGPVMVCKIGETEYETIQAAVNSVPEAGTATIEMINNSDKPATIPAGKTVTLNVNGYTLSNKEATGTSWNASTLRNYGTLTVNGGGTILADASKGSSMVLYNYEGGNATLNGCTYQNYNGDYTVWNQGGMTINNATVIKEHEGSNTVVINGWHDERPADKSCRLTVNNCTIEGRTPQSIGIRNSSCGELVINGGSITVRSNCCLQNDGISMEIHGGTFTVLRGPGGRVIYQNPCNETWKPAHLTISGGDFYYAGNESIPVIQVAIENNTPNVVEVSGGTFFKEDAVINQYATDAAHLISFAGKDQNNQDATRWHLGYTVTFNSNEGSAVASQDVVKGGTVSRPTAPTREGYTLSGWNLGDTAYDFDAPVTSNLTLTAQWQYNGGGGSYTPPVDNDDDGDDDDGGTPTPTPTEPDEPVVEIPDEDVPLVEVPDVEVPQTETPEELVEVPEEDVPLADVPKTGDNTGLWRMAALMSAAGLAVLTALERRQRREE